MEWRIVIDREYKYIEVISGGIADPAGSLDMAKAIADTMKANMRAKTFFAKFISQLAQIFAII